MLLISNVEILEGFAGALGLYFTKLVLTDHLNHKPYMLIGIVWFITWYIRKVSVNLYKNKKNIRTYFNKLKVDQTIFSN
tara:strand:+ start:1208 stop:1444 length:237 start_codon:yes stop_codon:yes gene_type:complete